MSSKKDSKIIILITGANTGIGYHTAKNILLSADSARYHVIIGSRNAEKGSAAAADLSAAIHSKGGSVTSVQLEVTNDASITAAVESVKAKFGRIDVLVNNAGVCPTAGDFMSNLRQCIDVNLVGALAVTEGFKSLLKHAARTPRVVFVSSSMASISQAADPNSRYYRNASGIHVSEYRISKAALSMAVVQLSKQYADEGGNFTHIKVLGADPGINRTELMRDQTEKSERWYNLPEELPGGKLVASVAVGEHDADAGKVIGTYGISPW